MTATQLLTLAREKNILLEVQGDRLVVDAPPGAVTPDLRSELVRHKPELMVLLAPFTEYVTLKGGLTLPLPALQLAWSLEERGFRLSLDSDNQVLIEPIAALTELDQAAIQRWRLHLGAIVAYQADAPGGGRQ
jgi:TubC N-terminal docking domain